MAALTGAHSLGAEPSSVSASGRSALLDQYRLDPDSTGVLAEKAPSDRRKVVLAVSLLVLGAVLIIVGANVFFLEQKGGIPLLVVGSLAFLPGAYYSYVALQTWRGKAGFSLSMIPDV